MRQFRMPLLVFPSRSRKFSDVHSERYASLVRPMLSPACPNLTGKFRATARRGCSYHFNRSGHGHRVGYSLHAHYGGEPLAKRCCALACRIVLPGKPANSHVSK